MMAATDTLMRRQARFHNILKDAETDAEKQKGVVIQAIRGRQWAAVSGKVAITESLSRLRESLSWQGKSPPKIVRDYRRKNPSK